MGCKLKTLGRTSGIGLAALFITLASAQPNLTAKPQVSLTEPKVRLIPISSNQLVFDIIETTDGTRLITHDRENAPRLWDTQSLALLRVMGNGSEKITTVEVSVTGNRILTISANSAKLWDSRFASIIAQFDAPAETQFTVGAISPDGTSAIVGTNKGSAHLFEDGSPFSAKILSIPGKTVGAVAFSKDGSTVAAGSDANVCGVWKRDGKAISTTKPAGNSRFIRWISFSSDGTQLLSTGLTPSVDENFQGTIELINTASGKTVFEKPHTYATRFLTAYCGASFAGTDQKYVIAFDKAGTPQLFNRQTGVLVKALEGNTIPIRELRVSADGSKIATYTLNDGIVIWDVNTFATIATPSVFAEPTAAAFSSDGKQFWIGSQDGQISKFTLGKEEVSTRFIKGAAEITEFGFIGKSGRIYIKYQETVRGFGAKYASRIWKMQTPGYRVQLPDLSYGMDFSSDGKFGYTYDNDARLTYMFGEEDEYGQLRINNYDAILQRFKFSDDGKYVAIVTDNGTITFGELENERDEKTYQAVAKKGDGYPHTTIFFPNSDYALITDYEIKGKQSVIKMNHRTGEVKCIFNEYYGMAYQIAISPDGRYVAFANERKIEINDGETGKLISTFETGVDEFVSSISFSKDSKYVVAGTWGFVQAFNLETKKLTCRAPESRHLYRVESQLHHQKPWVVAADGASVAVYDYETGKRVSEFEATEQVVGAVYDPTGTKIVTGDNSEGIVFWDAEPASVTVGDKVKIINKKLGAFVTLFDPNAENEEDRYSWMAIDPEGRYDAQNPDDITGANYILRWDNGLEPIAVTQLKQQFFEPGLMSKIWGTNRDPVRPVPSLDSLRLYPTISLAPNKRKPSEIEVSLKERDRGGIGSVRVFLNDKEVLTKEGIGYFKINLDEFRQYLMPESLLKVKEGATNILEVTATNKDGTLTSPPVVLDLGVPTDLKVPDVKMHALFVGIGDYVGTGGDLNAPPSDAESLGKALTSAAGSLLPGRIEATTMTSRDQDPTKRPTRSNILNWFQQTAAKAGVGDIVFVFFAGHGSSNIAGKAGYYFLTAEANPGDLNELSASTSTISGDDLKKALSSIAAQKQVLVLDTCHSGAASESLFASRSLPSDYQRAYEAIRESTGTWMLAGAAADQLSYEATNVEHGMLTYSLLEAIDLANGEGLRTAPGGELFLDVRTWLRYAAERVESLKNDVGLKAIQRPEIKTSPSNTSFDLGVVKKEMRGTVGLKPPKPVILLGSFSFDEEDPLKLEKSVQSQFAESTKLKYWPETAKHPNVYRVAGSYTVEGGVAKVKVFLQKLNQLQERKTLKTFDLTVAQSEQDGFGSKVLKLVEDAIFELENSAQSP